MYLLSPKCKNLKKICRSFAFDVKDISRGDPFLIPCKIRRLVKFCGNLEEIILVVTGEHADRIMYGASRL